MPPVVLHGDCLEHLRALPDCSVHAICTDPPYGLADHKPATLEATLLAWLTGDRASVPDGKGFMGRAWDAFVPPPAVWDECLRVLKPGGHMVVFAGSRTVDLMGLSIRLAGFEIRDEITTWLYGSGFPKSLDVSKAIDKARDDRDDIIAVTGWLAQQRDRSGLTNRDIDSAFGLNGMAGHWTSVKSQPAVPTWEQWLKLRELIGFGDEMDAEVWRLNGRKGTPGEAWGQREVIEERMAIQGGGTSLQLRMGERREVEANITAPATDAAKQWAGWGTALKPSHEPILVARKPLSGTVAQTVLEHGTGGLNIDACRVAHSDDLSRYDRSATSGFKNGGVYGDGQAVLAPASPAGRWPTNVVLVHSPDCDGQCAPSCPVAELDQQAPAVGANSVGNNPKLYKVRNQVYGAMPDRVPYDYGGDKGGASRFFPMFRYQAKAPSKERPKVNGKSHPTVKPLALMRWLVRLVTPPGGTLLDPFAGSGTTLEAALLEGFHSIGIERDAEYLPFIQQRIDRSQQPVSEPEPDGLFDLESA